jgi:hypothetical protein
MSPQSKQGEEMALGFSPEEQRAWMEKYRPHVEQEIGTQVTAFLPFHRTGAAGAMAAQRVSPLAAHAMRFIGKRKAGGLPPNFILVLTPERIHAYTSKTGRDSFELQDEVAVWERAAVRLSTQETSLNVQLTIESPADGQKVTCEATKSALTGDFFFHLSMAAA